MSVYIPKLEDMSISLLADGWHIMDKFGPLYGPYSTPGDANSAMIFESNNTSFVGCRHPSYAD